MKNSPYVYSSFKTVTVAMLPGAVGGVIGGLVIGGASAVVGYFAGDVLRDKARGQF